jgi:mono/diheme cytochrome c family protein
MRATLLKYSLFASVTAGLLLMLSGALPAQVTKYDEDQRLNMESHVGNMTGHAKDAKGNYRRYCVGCHGEEGDGMGENEPWLDPKPRNFTLAQFKCRSTPTGTLPTDEDLYNTLGRGLDRSVMPPWNTLTKRDKVDLVAYVKHFSPKWTTEKPGAAIQIPPEPAVTAERIQAGQALFQKLECWKCHGVEGRANGPSSDTLQDDQNRPIRPYNFAEGSRPKCGSSDADIYRIFMTGLDGTPMPSFADNVKPDEAWDLVFYLRTLQPMKTKERMIAKQLGLKPINPNAADATPAASPAPTAATPAPGNAAPATTTPSATPDNSAPAAPTPAPDTPAPTTPPASAPQQ